MALSGSERAKIREFLGWGTRFFQIDNRLELAMDAMSEYPYDVERIRATITELDNLDTRLAGARDRLQASTVGSITLNPAEIMQLRMEGARYCQTLAHILRVEIQRGGKYGAGGGGGYLDQG